jgi:flagellar basal-body rod modification protein FlgD
MVIQNSMAAQIETPLPPTTSNTGAGTTNPASTSAEISSTDAIGNETTFLQLLVAQIQNQDPTQPMDSSTFLTQLAEFTQVEQLIGIRQDVQELDPASASATSGASTNPTSGS